MTSKRPRSRQQRVPLPPSAKSTPSRGAVPIVGVGASAGGLEAFEEFLGALPADTGMAFVFVQHLDPTHRSLLTELLATKTTMPVREVTHGVRVEPNRIYVIPPDRGMTVEDGVLKLTQRGATALHKPIDTFFVSLAQERGSNAIGVILSGTANDGTKGLKAIKAEGGITFAQSERSAKHEGMPRSAIAAGCVDRVLDPAGIAREVAEFVRHPYILRPHTDGDASERPDTTHLEIFRILRAATGVDFTHYKQATIHRRVQRRMLLLRLESAARYLQRLRDDSEEVQALFHDLLINVTSFFREPDALEALKKRVFPALLRGAQERGSGLRIWVPGCSTGEEAYSIAIVLLEATKKLGREPGAQIFGTDVDELALEKARAGVYLPSIQNEVSDERLRRFFTKVPAGFQVSPGLRDLCVFAKQDVTRDPPFSQLDLVSCRNLLIYLGPILQRQALATFHYALKPNGYLLLGRHEASGSSELFAALEKKQRLFARRRGAPSRVETPRPFARPRAALDSAAAKAANGPGDAQREADRLVLSRYGPPSVIADDRFRVVVTRGRTESYLKPAKEGASLIEIARGGLGKPLRRLLAQVRGKSAAAPFSETVRIKSKGREQAVRLTVMPLRAATRSERKFLVLFEDAPSRAPRARPLAASDAQELAKVREELATTKQYLHSIIEDQEASNEELRSANEEIQSSNEELQSANEELETAEEEQQSTNEELQSTNEELSTVNDELRGRNLELATLGNDLHNFHTSANIPILMLGRDLRIRRFTPSASRVFNLIETDVGRPLTEINPNVNVDGLQDLVVHVLEHLTLVERQIQDRSGRWYTMTIRPYLTVDKRLDGVVLALVDVDALKRSLEEMRTARNFAEAIVETTRQPLVVLRADLSVQKANHSFYEFFGLDRSEVEQRPLPSISRGQFDFPELRTKVLPGTEHVQDLEIEREFDGLGRRTMVVNARKIDGPDGNDLVLLGFEDVTEAKRTAELRYRRPFESSKASLLVLSAVTGQVTDLSPSLLQTFGFAREDLLGRRIAETDLVPDVSFGQGLIAKAAAGEPIGNASLMSKAGQRLDVEIDATSYGEGEGRLLLLSIRDVTARLRAEEAVRQGQKMEAIGRLAGGIAHDFNNLLTTILGFSDHVLRKADDPRVVREDAAQIQKAGMRAAALTSQLLAYSRRQRLEKRVVDLNAIVNEVEPMLRSLIGEQAEISTSLDPTLARVTLDPHQMEQALVNLAMNARDSMPKGGKLRIETANAQLLPSDASGFGVQPGTFASLTISDTGVGMDREVLSHLFEPFFTTKAKGEGTGLGLSMVDGLVRQSGGAIRVHSEVGGGTTIRIYLPRCEQALSSEPEPPPQPPEGTETILLAEDDDGVRTLIAGALREFGYHVIEASGGVEALAMARRWREPIHLLLTDVIMPKKSGPELFRELAGTRPELRVVFMSGYAGNVLLGEGGALASALFLAKPFTNFELGTTVRAALDSAPVCA